MLKCNIYADVEEFNHFTEAAQRINISIKPITVIEIMIPNPDRSTTMMMPPVKAIKVYYTETPL